MKLTLLEMTQKILTVMDSEQVNSISDSVEAMQVASIIEDVYYTVVTARLIPEHQSLIQLTALADSAFPTHFLYGSATKRVCEVYYDISETAGETAWRPIKFYEPLDFLDATDGLSSDSELVLDKVAGTNLTIGNADYPTFYTSFDDDHIVMNSYKSTIESTLQSSKIRAYGTTIPSFTISDSFEPDLNELLFPYFLAESMSTCLVTLKGEANQKIEQQARRLKSYVQNDRYKTERSNVPKGYGR